MAHNIVVDLYREKSKYPFEGQEDILLNLPEGETPETSIFLKIENENLRKALWELTGDQRDVIVLRFIEGLQAAEVAKILDKTEGAVRALQRRALVALSGHFSRSKKKIKK